MKDKDIPYIVFESTTARMERTIVRLWVALIVVLFFLMATNIAWITYESQFEETSTTITQDVDSGESGNAIINDGVHINDESNTDSNN